MEIGELEDQFERATLEPTKSSDDTPESARFRALPQELQRRLLTDYPRALATAMHQYSRGTDFESILMRIFESSSEMLRVRDSEGDTPVAAALLMGQDGRAENLVELAGRKNPAALDCRSRYGESLLMLSTSSSPAGHLMERLLQRDPTQLHRLYDIDGRNFLHHCALEESVEVLEAALRMTAELIKEGRLSATQVSAAVHMNDRSGDTPMHMMAACNRVNMLRLLLQFGSEVGIDIKVDERQHRDRRQTPLMVAAKAGAADVAELLVSRGADPAGEDTEGETALSLAAGNARMLRVLGEEEGMDVAQTGTDKLAEAPSSAAANFEEQISWLTGGQPVHSVDSAIGSSGLSGSSAFSATMDSGTQCISQVKMSPGKAPILRVRVLREEEGVNTDTDRLADATLPAPSCLAAADTVEQTPWLTGGHPVRSVDSAIGSFVSSGSFAMDSGAQCISQEELAHLEAHLESRGKSMAFLRALCRLDQRLEDSMQKNGSILDVSKDPVRIAFGLWTSAGVQVPPSLVMMAIGEVDAL